MKLFALLFVLLVTWSFPASATVLRDDRLESWRSLPREAEMEVFVEGVFRLAGKPMKVPVVIDPAAEPYCAYAANRGGQPIIGIGRKCLGYLRRGGVLRWHAVSILCHEIGHIVGSHIYNAGSYRWEEIEADEWSGWAMYHLGATLDQAIGRAMLFDEEGGNPHPPRKVRVESYKRGWLRARAGGPQFQPQSTRGSWWAEFMALPLPWAK